MSKKDAAYRDDEYLQAKALFAKRKASLMAKRRDAMLNSVILSDEISQASSKYVLPYQPDWVNLSMYKQKMAESIGREWSLSTEFFHAIKPDVDVPHGYMVQPTSKDDGEESGVTYKTKFGPKSKKKPMHSQSMYNNNFLVRRPKRMRRKQGRPERDRA